MEGHLPSFYTRFLAWAVTNGTGMSTDPDAFRLMWYAWWQPGDNRTIVNNARAGSGTTPTFHGRQLLQLANMWAGDTDSTFRSAQQAVDTNSTYRRLRQAADTNSTSRRLRQTADTNSTYPSAQHLSSRHVLQATAGRHIAQPAMTDSVTGNANLEPFVNFTTTPPLHFSAAESDPAAFGLCLPATAHGEQKATVVLCLSPTMSSNITVTSTLLPSLAAAAAINVTGKQLRLHAPTGPSLNSPAFCCFLSLASLFLCLSLLSMPPGLSLSLSFL